MLASFSVMAVFHYKISLLPRTYFGQQLPAALSGADMDRGEDSVSGWWSPILHLNSF
jgi:hypothetical protein